MKNKKVNVAIVGLGFGAEFIPIYQSHPLANMYAICQRTRKRLDAVGDAFSVDARYTDFNELLKDSNVDAVHINSPIPDHAWMSIAALKAGKHVACTVPMATSIEDCKKIVELGEEDRPEIHDDGNRRVCPRISLHEGAAGQGRARQNSIPAGEPSAGHGRLAKLLARPSADVVCHSLRRSGAGLVGASRRVRFLFRLRHDSQRTCKKYGSPFAVETAHIKFKDSDVSARIYPFAVRHSPPISREHRRLRLAKHPSSGRWSSMSRWCFTRAKLPEAKIPKRVKAPDYAKRLPEEIRRFTTKGVYDFAKNTHLSFTQGAGHGGSHPHLVHEFVQALLQIARRFPMPGNPPIGPVWGFARTSPQCREAPSSTYRGLLSGNGVAEGRNVDSKAKARLFLAGGRFAFQTAWVFHVPDSK